MWWPKPLAIVLPLSAVLLCSSLSVAQSRYGASSTSTNTDASELFSKQFAASQESRAAATSAPPTGRYGASTDSRLKSLGETNDAASSVRSPRTEPRRASATDPFSRETRSTSSDPQRPPAAYSRQPRSQRSNPLRDTAASAPSSISRGLPQGSVAGAAASEVSRVDKTREEQTRKMLGRMMRAPENSRLSGSPTRLSTLLQRVGSRQEQAAVTDAYWALTSSAIDYYLSLHEVDEASRLRQSAPTYSTALGQMERALRTRVDTSLKSARAAQMNLERLVPGISRPLPSDVPFCGPYATRFDQIFPAGASEEARLLVELLPLRLGEIEAAAESVARYEQWVKQVEQASARSKDGTGIVRALELLALSRRALVQLVRDYNQKINRYARLATPGEVDTSRLVAMLIRTDQLGATGRSVLADDRSQRLDNGRQAGLDFGAAGVGSRR